MILALLQIVLSSIAGFAVFCLWRRIAAASRTIFWLVTTGLLVRALGGVLAFWISYLGLPVARSLQAGRGLWVFAIDAMLYVQYALSYAAGGVQSILLVDKTLPAPFFIQTLAVAMLCFGSMVSVAILLNLAAYLGCCAVILSFGDPTRRPAVFAIAALSLSPSAIVWSLQPLKDVTFLFLVMAFFGAARAWQQLWKNETNRYQIVQGVLWSTIMAGLLYGISGIRWYFGMVTLIAVVPFVVMTIIGSHTRIAAAAVSVLFLLPLAFVAFVAAAGPYIPLSIQKALRTRDVKKQAAVPEMILTTMSESRRGFDRAGGATIIGAGSAIRRIDAALAGGASPPRTPPLRTPATRTPPAPNVATVAAPPSSPEREPPVLNVAKPSTEDRVEVEKEQTAANPTLLTQSSPTPAPNAAAVVPQPSLPIEAPVSEVATRSPEYRMEVRKKQSTANPGRPTQAVPAPNGAATTATKPVQPPPPSRTAAQQPPPTTVLPVSPLARILAGTAAIVLPQSLARWLGIVDVRGGRSLWLFVEIDTLVFDMVLGFALFSMAAALRRRTLGAPVFWLALIVTGTVGLALVYTVSNFGTLFRHRGMLLVGLVLLPLAAAAPAARMENLPDQEPAR